MFNFNLCESGSSGGNSSPTAPYLGTQSTSEADTDYFGACQDWNLYRAGDVQRSQSFTTSPSQCLEVAGNNLESPVTSGDGPPVMTAIRIHSFPGQEDKVAISSLFIGISGIFSLG